ncbi:MAG: hybrid sensor histidine kinase/response regulator [Novosphingobium sp.]|nr:MAG: hybrid sensor histidine kinase/response regulator [Novosphingobium sp.]
MTTRPGKQPSSFSRALLVNIIAFYGALALGSLAIMAWQATESTNEAAERGITEMLDGSASRIGQLVHAAELAAGSLERVALDNPIDGGSLRPSLDKLLAAFEQHPYLSYMGIIVPTTGEYGLLERKANGRIGLVLYPEARRRDALVRTFTLVEEGFVADRSYPSNGYDARTRPFYRGAVNGPAAGGWMPIYPWRDYARPEQPLWGFSFVKALRDDRGSIRGVIDTDFDMPALNRLVRALSNEYHGQIQVLQLGPKPRLIAGPGLTTTPRDTPAELLALTRETGTPFVGKMALDGSRKWVATRQIPIAGGERWLVVVSRPAQFFDTILHRQLIQSLLLGLAAAVGIGLLSLRIGRRFGRPLADLEGYFARVGRSDPTLRDRQIPASAQDFQETSRLGLAIDRMLVERADLEQRLAQRQRLEALGQLTGGIAHDFNNLLAVIIGSSEDLVEDLRDREHLELAGLILSTSERAAELTGRMLSFARKQALSPCLVDVDSLIDGLLPLLRRSVPNEIAIRHQAASLPNTVFVDPTQLEMALLNLVINARDAMPDGGIIAIGAEHFATGESRTLHAELRPGRYVRVFVADDGAGMGEEIARQAFDPFFTTKGIGSGTGLGLSMVYGFASQSGGHAEIISRYGEGTTVRLYLPAAPARASDKGEAPMPGPS